MDGCERMSHNPSRPSVTSKNAGTSQLAVSTGREATSSYTSAGAANMLNRRPASDIGGSGATSGWAAGGVKDCSIKDSEDRGRPHKLGPDNVRKPAICPATTCRH